MLIIYLKKNFVCGNATMSVFGWTPIPGRAKIGVFWRLFGSTSILAQTRCTPPDFRQTMGKVRAWKSSAKDLAAKSSALSPLLSGRFPLPLLAHTPQAPSRKPSSDLQVPPAIVVRRRPALLRRPSSPHPQSTESHCIQSSAPESSSTLYTLLFPMV